MTISSALAALCMSVFVSGMLAGMVPAARAASAKAESPATAAQPAHIASRQEFAAIFALKATAAEAIARNDLPALIKVHDEVAQRLLRARRDMDLAFLTGAWRSADIKQAAAQVLGQAEAVHMLNFISLAFLKGYESPTGKVSASIIDANSKMFLQLEQLLRAMDALGTKALSRAGRDGQ